MLRSDPIREVDRSGARARVPASPMQGLRRCRRHQPLGRNFPLPAVSNPGERENKLTGVAQRLKLDPIVHLDWTGQLASPPWLPPRRHKWSWVVLANLAGSVADAADAREATITRPLPGHGIMQTASACHANRQTKFELLETPRSWGPVLG